MVVKKMVVKRTFSGSIIEIDTTDFSKMDYQTILNEVKSAMQKYQVGK